MAGIRTNREILTGGKKYLQKQAKKHGVEEVNFDKENRKDYLTGFHKRKLQRQKKAQEYIKEQERLGRIEERRLAREERQKDVEKQLQDFKQNVKRITHLDSDDEDDAESKESGSEEWTGFGEGEDEDPETATPKGILHHTEVYKVDDTDVLPEGQAIIDEETEVTVESLENPIMRKADSITIDAIAKANNVDLNKSEDVLKDSIKRAQNYAVVCGVAKPSAKDKLKQKKKKFRYLTKAERRENNRKVKESKRKSARRD